MHFARRWTALMIVASLGLACGGTEEHGWHEDDGDLDVDVAGDERSTFASKAADLKIVSWNVWHGNGKANLRAALKGFESAAVDVVGLQELADKGKPDALRRLTGKGRYYAAWIPGSPARGGNVSILYRRSRFSVVVNKRGRALRFARRVHGPEHVEDGAGGTRTTSKYIVYVMLRDRRTGRAFWVMNAHGLATVEGQPGYPNHKARRLRLYRKMMRTFADINSNKRAPVFITGDYNVNYRGDRKVRYHGFPYASFNRLRPRIKSNWEWHERGGLRLPGVGTHRPHRGGKRLIDYVFAKADPGVSYAGTAIWTHRRFGSDHAPVQATYRLR
jgi:endonuclease/exonuclease/phosphatase family metal-dependent hydrolase